MKNKWRIFFIGLVSFLLFSSKVFSQTIPSFKMYRSDKTIFNSIDLPKSKPTILIYFDPDCEHCQHLMKEFFQKINEFKKAEVVMVTYKSIEEVAAFERQHDIQKYKNIVVGTEGLGFYLRNYYGIMTMPFTALYDKKGNLNYSYRKDTSVSDLIDRIKKIQ